jgi:hypothetical protein
MNEPTVEKCASCSSGYLIEEYSDSNGETHYYCNHCFRYEIRKPKSEGAMVQEAVQESSLWEGFTEEEIDRILETVLNDRED